MIRIGKLFLMLLLVQCCGCNILEHAASDINGWDLSACVKNFGTCWELYMDNSDKFSSLPVVDNQ